MTPEQYIREAIEMFRRDPADTPYQEGYFEALLTVAREAFGLDVEQLQEKPRQMAKLTLIRGGKQDHEPPSEK